MSSCRSARRSAPTACRTDASARRSAAGKAHAVVRSVARRGRGVGVACNAGLPAACRSRASWPVKSPSAWVVSCPCAAILGVMAALAPAMGLFVPLNRPAGCAEEAIGQQQSGCWREGHRRGLVRRKRTGELPTLALRRRVRQGLFVETQNKVAISSKRLFSVISFALLPHTDRRNLRHRWRPLGGPKPLLPTPAAPFPVVPSGGALRRSVVRLYGKGDRVWMTTADPALLSPPSMFWTPTSCSMTPTLC